jgi:hypothetical protein
MFTPQILTKKDFLFTTYGGNIDLLQVDSYYLAARLRSQVEVRILHFSVGGGGESTCPSCSASNPSFSETDLRMDHSPINQNFDLNKSRQNS